MPSGIVELKKILYDVRARDGTWCTRPYEGYPKGCFKFPSCPRSHPDFLTLKSYRWFAVIEEFNLRAHAEHQREKHRNWTEKQLRNPRHWQSHVASLLRRRAYSFSNRLMGDIILEVPEACGINVLGTMALAGITIQMKNPDIIRKIMLVGKP